MCPWRCGGQQGRRRGGGADLGATKPVVAVGGLWDELQAPAKCRQYLCDALTWRGRSQGLLHGQARPGKARQGF